MLSRVAKGKWVKFRDADKQRIGQVLLVYSRLYPGWHSGKWSTLPRTKHFVLVLTPEGERLCVRLENVIAVADDPAALQIRPDCDDSSTGDS